MIKQKQNQKKKTNFYPLLNMRIYRYLGAAFQAVLQFSLLLIIKIPSISKEKHFIRRIIPL